jgi:hypothetical protein
MNSEKFSLRSIDLESRHSKKKVTEVIQKAKDCQFSYPLTEEMTDIWLEELLFPEKTTGRIIKSIRWILIISIIQIERDIGISF